MIDIFLLFLPCAVCMVALPTLALKLHKLSTDGVLIVVCSLMMLYFFTYAYTEHVWVVITAKVLGVAILPLILLWLYRTGGNPLLRYRNQEWSARDKYIVRAEMAVLVGAVADIVRQVLCMLTASNGICSDGMHITGLVLACIQAVCIYVFYASAIYIGIIDNPAINKDTYRAVQQARQSKLRDDFELLMTEQRLYLKPGLTIEDVALMLATNRTYISQMLRNDYGCTFPEYLVEKRLEYSKEFMLSHPLEVQEEIAFQCGFPSAPAFNKRFREQYGQTPKEWFKQNKNA